MASVKRPSRTRLTRDLPLCPASPRGAGCAAWGVGERAMVLGSEIRDKQGYGASARLVWRGGGLREARMRASRRMRPAIFALRHVGHRSTLGASADDCRRPPRQLPRNEGHPGLRTSDCKNRLRQHRTFRVFCTNGGAQVGDLQRFLPGCRKTWQAIKDLLLGLKKTVNSSRPVRSVGQFQAGFFKFPSI